jgi:hypothetical protein
VSSLKNRLAKLEAAWALKNKPVEELYDPDGSKLIETIKRINAEALLGLPTKPWVICPPPDETDIIGTHLHNTCNRIAERDQREEREQMEQGANK